MMYFVFLSGRQEKTRKISLCFYQWNFLQIFDVKSLFADLFDCMDSAILRDVARWTDGVLQGIGFADL